MSGNVSFPVSTPQPITATSLPLPAGASTAALQPALNADGGALAHITNLPATQQISATALPNPTGAPTATAQAAQLAAEQAIQANTAVFADVFGTATIASGSTTAVTIPTSSGKATIRVTIAGLTAAGGVLASLASTDGTNFLPTYVSGSPPGTTTNSITVDGTYLFRASGTKAVQLAITTAGTSAIAIVYGQSSATDGVIVAGRPNDLATSRLQTHDDTVAAAQAGTGLKVLDANSAAFQGEFAMTVGTSYTAGRSFKANCSAAGNVSITYPDASTGLWPLVVGIQTIPAAATMINSSGTTATATYTGLK